MTTHVAVEPPSTTLSAGGVIVLAVGAFDFGLEQAIVVPALPAMAEHYGASVSAIGWVVTGFLLAGIVSIPLLGRLGDLFGKRRLLLVALGAFAVGSLLCAVTDSAGLVIAGRIVQGVGMGAAPLILGLTRDTSVPQHVPRAVGAVVGAGSAGVAIGFLLSGLLVDHVSVPAIFWFLFLLAAAVAVGVGALVPESPVRAQVSIDVVGAVLLAAGLATLLLAISKGNEWDWTSPRVLGLFAFALASLTAFVLVERRVAEPLVDVGLIGRRPFVNAHLCHAVFGFSAYLAVFVIPLIASLPGDPAYGLAFSTTQIGLILLPSGLGSMASAWVGGRLLDRVGSRALVALGALPAIAGYALLALADWTPAVFVVASALFGVAWGLVVTGVYPLVLRSATVDQTGVAVAVNLVVRNTALAVGTQVAFAIIENAGVVDRLPAESGFMRVFVLGLVGCCLMLLVARLLPGRAAVRR